MISTFLKYYESKIEDNGIAKFKSINGDIEELEYELIADSVYDQTFKRIFDWNLIIDVIEIRNEEGKLAFDIACRCICWEGNKEKEVEELDEENIFDVEIQIGYEANFVTRLLEYGFSLRNDETLKKDEEKENKEIKKDIDIKKKKKYSKRKPVKVLSFLNYDINNTNNINYKSYKTVINFEDPDGKIIGTLENPPVEVYGINLPYEINKLLNKETLKFNHKNINKSGEEWIKLLGLRHWASRDEYPFYHKYIIPKNVKDSDKTIQNVIKILGMVRKEDIREYIKDETRQLGQLESAREDGIKVGEKKRSYKTCEVMLSKNETEGKISLYTDLSIEEINQFKESLKKRKTI